jgi:hypothetical protein
MNRNNTAKLVKTQGPTSVTTSMANYNTSTAASMRTFYYIYTPHISTKSPKLWDHITICTPHAATIECTPHAATIDYYSPKLLDRKRNITNAVYAHLQAMRSLGHTRVSPENVSKALGISFGAVLVAMKSLESKGVRRVK